MRNNRSGVASTGAKIAWLLGCKGFNATKRGLRKMPWPLRTWLGLLTCGWCVWAYHCINLWWVDSHLAPGEPDTGIGFGMIFLFGCGLLLFFITLPTVVALFVRHEITAAKARRAAGKSALE